MSEVPGGISNAWDEPGSMLASTNDVVAKRAATSYCNNRSHSYASEGYQYIMPDCVALLPAELTQKTVDSVFYTTAYLETVTRGWPCERVNTSEVNLTDLVGDMSSGENQQTYSSNTSARATRRLLRAFNRPMRLRLPACRLSISYRGDDVSLRAPYAPPSVWAFAARPPERQVQTICTRSSNSRMVR